MPPKRGKGKKRNSEENGDKSDDSSSIKSGGTDLLSPCEGVKMRKKTRFAIAEENNDTTTPVKEARVKTTRNSSTERTIPKKDKIREQDKKKDTQNGKKNKKEKGDVEEIETKTKTTKRNSGKRKNLAESDTQAHVMYPCGICMKEVSDTDEAILCEAGCEYWYHRHCSGMTDIAYKLLTNEHNAEWVCDKCIATKSILLVKIKPQNTLQST